MWHCLACVTKKINEARSALDGRKSLSRGWYVSDAGNVQYWDVHLDRGQQMQTSNPTPCPTLPFSHSSRARSTAFYRLGVSSELKRQASWQHQGTQHESNDRDSSTWNFDSTTRSPEEEVSWFYLIRTHGVL